MKDNIDRRHTNTDPVLGNISNPQINTEVFNGKIQRRQGMSRREFLKTMFAVGGAAVLGNSVLAACIPLGEQPGGTAYSPTLVPYLDGFNEFEIGQEVPPEVAFLSVAVRVELTKQLELIVDPKQRDILAAMLLQNAKVARGDFYKLQQEAINSGNAIGFSGCSDSRVCITPIFPNTPSGIGEVNPISGNIALLPESRVGTQPAIFQENVTQSIFAVHQSADCVPGGCGVWDGIDALVTNPSAIAELKKHGVSQLTIDEINRLYLIAQSGGADNPVEWSRVGARMQAELNTFHYGGNHFTAYGIIGHADGTFTLGGVIDAHGIDHPIDNFPKLKAATSYLNTPHPIIEELVAGQKPVIIAVNGSTHTTSGLFGDLSQTPGIVFKSDVKSIPGVPISPIEAKNAIAGADYAVGALSNEKVMVLIADNADDMRVLRTTLMTEGVKAGSITAFLEGGGVIVEMIPDQTGRFTGLANVITAEDLAVDVAKLDLARSGTARLALNIEGNLIGQMELRARRNLELGVINEAQFAKVQKLITFLRTPALRATGTFFKYGFQIAGDYMMINDLAKFSKETLSGYDIVWTNRFDNENIIWRPNAHVLTSEETNSVLSQYPEVALKDPVTKYLLSGMLDKVIVRQSSLVVNYLQAWNAWWKYGPGQTQESEPWSKMASPNDVGKFLELEIPPINAAEGLPIRLMTSLYFKPNDDNLDGTNIFYNPEDPNQMMMLVDQTTGIPILGNIPGQHTTIGAVDINNPAVTYIFEVSVPENPEVSRRFEFKFVGLMPALPQEVSETSDEFASIPVEPDSVFAPPALVS